MRLLTDMTDGIKIKNCRACCRVYWEIKKILRHNKISASCHAQQFKYIMYGIIKAR